MNSACCKSSCALRYASAIESDAGCGEEPLSSRTVFLDNCADWGWGGTHQLSCISVSVYSSIVVLYSARYCSERATSCVFILAVNVVFGHGILVRFFDVAGILNIHIVCDTSMVVLGYLITGSIYSVIFP